MTGSLKFKGDSSAQPSKRKRRRIETPEREQGRLSPVSTHIDEPLTPPRKGWAKSAHSYEYNLCDGFEYEEASFSQRLQDAIEEDDREWRPHSEAYVPQRWRNSTQRAKNGVTSTQSLNENGAVLTEIILPMEKTMDDEGYAEYVRVGMFRRTHADAIRVQEELAKEEAAREKLRQAERERALKAETERIRRLEEQKQAQTAAQHRSAREAYAVLWKRLLESNQTGKSLTFDDFPWPFPSTSPALDKETIRSFLTAHLPSDDPRSHKQALRLAVIAYHPDRFDKYVALVSETKGERQRVREMGLRVSQILNELLVEKA